MSENYFIIVEMGKNVRKFLFRRSTKMSENGPKKCKMPKNNVRNLGL